MKKWSLLVISIVLFQGCASIHHSHDNWKLEAAYPHLHPRDYLRNYNVPKNLLREELARQLLKNRFFVSREVKGKKYSTTQDLRYPGVFLDVQFEEPLLILLEQDYVSSIASWLFTAIGTFWVHTNQFQLSYIARVKVFQKKDNKLLYSEVVPVRYRDYLNFHERTSGFFPYVLAIFVPPVLLPSDGGEVLYYMIPPSMTQVTGRIEYAFLNLKSLPVEVDKSEITKGLEKKEDQVSKKSDKKEEKNPKGPDKKEPEKKGPEKKGPEKKGPEKKGPEKKGPEKKGPEKKGPEKKGPEKKEEKK